MSYSVRFFGHNNCTDEQTSIELRPGKTYEDLFALSDSKMLLGKVALQTMSQVALTIKIQYSIYPFCTETNPDEEIWFDYKTISISANTPKIEDFSDLPTCKYLKYTVEHSGTDPVSYATICTMFW